jgi:MFS family permease
MLYAYALVFGTLSGIFIPASSSIVPKLVTREELQLGNSLVQGTAQLSVFIGPVLAGAVIAFFAAGGAKSTMEGIGLAIAFDALTFLISVATLWLMRREADKVVKNDDILGSIKEGVVFVYKDPALRAMFIIMAGVNFLFSGPFLVGVPIIANDRLVEGAAAFGLLMSAYGGGNLAGILLSGPVKPRPALMGYITMGIIALFGVGIAIVGFITSTWLGCLVMAILGIFNGFLAITLITMLQKITPMAMMGRLMSLVMLAGVGLVPVSQALSGFFMKYGVGNLFAACGVIIIAMAAAALLVPEIRNIGSRM